jgi:hypothetical protein
VGSSPTARTRLGKVDKCPESDDDIFDEDENRAVRDFERLTAILFQRVSERSKRMPTGSSRI